jgi:hypothetical protein
MLATKQPSTGCGKLTAAVAQVREYHWVDSSHFITTFPSLSYFDGRRFHNRERFPDPTFWDEVEIAWTLRTKTKNWPDHFQTPPAELPKDPVLHGIRILWVGHAAALIQTPTLNIITDPVLFDSIGPVVPPIKTVTNPGVTVDGLPRIDVILISCWSDLELVIC